MEIKTFKKAFKNTLLSKGLLNRKNYFVKFYPEVTLVIGLQKSNYANGYYINLAYIINLLHPVISNPWVLDGDISARFEFDFRGKKIDFVDLDEWDENDDSLLKNDLVYNYELYIAPVNSIETLKDLLIKNPIMLYLTTVEAKKALGFE